jgi:hypothetical protein
MGEVGAEPEGQALGLERIKKGVRVESEHLALGEILMMVFQRGLGVTADLLMYHYREQLELGEA